MPVESIEKGGDGDRQRDAQAVEAILSYKRPRNSCSRDGVSRGRFWTELTRGCSQRFGGKFRRREQERN